MRQALAEGKIAGDQALPVKVTLTLGAVGLSIDIDGSIEFQ